MPEFDPEQTLALLVILPPIETGSTVIVTSDEFSSAQVPSFTTALYLVVDTILLYA